MLLAACALMIKTRFPNVSQFTIISKFKIHVFKQLEFFSDILLYVVWGMWRHIVHENVFRRDRRWEYHCFVASEMIMTQMWRTQQHTTAAREQRHVFAGTPEKEREISPPAWWVCIGMLLCANAGRNVRHHQQAYGPKITYVHSHSLFPYALARASKAKRMPIEDACACETYLNSIVL